MRIALIHLGRRGAGNPISFELARQLAQEAETLAVLSDQAENLAIWQRSGLNWMSAPTYRTGGQAILSWVFQSGIRHLAEKVRRWQPDVLLFPMFYTWNPFLQQRLAGIPSVVAVHDPAPHPGLRNLAYRLLEDGSIRRASRCLIFSQVLVPDLERRGVAAEKIDWVPHGGLSYYRQFEDTGGPQAGKPTLLFFGRITSYKGLDQLLTAFRRVRQEVEARLLVVGAGDLRPYRTLLQLLPDVEVVNRWIEEPEIASFFQQANIVVLPYTSASQSGVVPLAASFGLPVIATRVGGIPEQVEHLRTGLLVAPGSPEELAEALLQLLQNPRLARQLGENLQQEYLANKRWDQIAQQVLLSCQKAMGAGSSTALNA